MNHQRTMRYAVLLSLLLLGLGGAGTARGDMVYLVTVDTTSLDGESGILSFEFNPGLGTYQSATALISGLTIGGGGTLSGETVLYGDAGGNLNGLSENKGVQSGQLALNNTTAFNDGDQYLTYGTSITFNVTLSGPAIDSPKSAASGTTFSFFVQDTSFNPLLTDTTSNPGGSILNLDIAASSGSVTATTYPSEPGGVTATPQDATAPAPSGMALALLGMASVATCAALRRRLIQGPPGGVRFGS